MFNGPICIVFETNKVIYEHFGPHYWSQLQKRALKRIVVPLAKECNNLSAVFKKYHFLRLIFHTFDKKLPYQVCLNTSPGIQVKMHFYQLWDGNFFWPKCTVLLVFFSYTNVQYFWYFFDPNVQYFWYFFFLSQIYSTFGIFSDSKCTVLLVFYFSDPNVQYFLGFFMTQMYSTFGTFFADPKCTVLKFQNKLQGANFASQNPAWVTMREMRWESWLARVQTCLQEELILDF